MVVEQLFNFIKHKIRFMKIIIVYDQYNRDFQNLSLLAKNLKKKFRCFFDTKKLLNFICLCLEPYCIIISNPDHHLVNFHSYVLKILKFILFRPSNFFLIKRFFRPYRKRTPLWIKYKFS